MNDCRDPRQAVLFWTGADFTSRWRAHVACAASRIDSVPQAKWGEIREQACAPCNGEDMACPVRRAAFGQKTCKPLKSRRAPAHLPFGARVGSKAEIGVGRNGPKRNIDRAKLGRRGDRLGHDPVPSARPSGAGCHAAVHAVLGDFSPRQAMCTAPSGHGAVPPICPIVASFLMRPQRAKLTRRVKPLQNCAHLAQTNHQSLAAARQIAAQLLQTFCNERPVPGGHVGLRPELWLDDIKGNDRSARRRLGQNAVIPHPQVAFEPDDLHGGVRVHLDVLWSERGLCFSWS